MRNVCKTTVYSSFAAHRRHLTVCRGRGGGRGEGRGGAGKGDKGDIAGNIYKIIKMIKEKNLEPVIVFSFSRR